MTERTVVAIESGMDDVMLLKLLKARAPLPSAAIWQEFECSADDLPAWGTPEAVRERGKRILEKLSAHPAVKEAIDDALKTPLGGVSSIFFRLMAREAERFCWEALCRPTGDFLALDRRWPIARIADSAVDRATAAYEFTPPLKILAMISALGVGGAGEWTSLKSAIIAARADGLPIEIALLSGQDSVLNAVKQDVDGGLSGVSVDALPATRAELEARIQKESPHVLHFFSHGSSANGIVQLQLATRLDELQGASSGSLRIHVENLMGIPAMRSVWLVALNSCLGSQPSGDIHSMAHQLVGNGVPAAVAMLEEVDAEDAHTFCRGFYAAIFQQIRDALDHAKDGKTVAIEWCHALYDSRIALTARHKDDPANHREWALPVLYVGPDPFLLKGSDPAALSPADLSRMRAETEEVAAALRSLPPNTPDAVRMRLLALLDDVPNWMRPDLRGNFAAPTGG